MAAGIAATASGRLLAQLHAGRSPCSEQAGKGGGSNPVLHGGAGLRPQSPAVHIDLGLALSEQGKLAEAETLFREALAMQKKLLTSEHPDVARSLDGIASVFYSEQNFAEAETLYREALAMQRKLLSTLEKK